MSGHILTQSRGAKVVAIATAGVLLYSTWMQINGHMVQQTMTFLVGRHST